MRTADAKLRLVVAKHLSNLFIEIRPVVQPPLGKAQPDHRIAPRPVPATLGLQPPEQRLVALEQFREGIQEQ
jgi:hypothetical protein